MRIRPSYLLAALGGLAGLAVAVTPAGAHTKPAHALTRGCPVRHVSVHGGHHIRHLHVTWRHGGWSGRHGMAMRHGWQGGHSWHEEHGWSDQHGWSEGDGRWAEGREHRWGAEWGQRPWATDRYGYLTWPGKTHFASGQPVEGATPPPPPPPPEDMQGPPPGPQADEDGETYIIRRF